MNFPCLNRFSYAVFFFFFKYTKLLMTLKNSFSDKQMSLKYRHIKFIDIHFRTILFRTYFLFRQYSTMNLLIIIIFYIWILCDDIYLFIMIIMIWLDSTNTNVWREETAAEKKKKMSPQLIERYHIQHV